MVTALDPDNHGAILWQTRIGRGGWVGGIEWGPATDGVNLYVALSDMSWVANLVLDPRAGGGLFALNIATGAKIWVAPPPSCEGRKNCSPAQSAAVSAVPGAVFSGSEDGHIRAYSTENGEIIWDFNTAREFTAVNQVPAKGGSIDGPGPAIADGMVYVPSGYGVWGGLPGNVLLAFSPDDN
jgi:polyvinyl alcohol dehydrogenase (cytochrome)